MRLARNLVMFSTVFALRYFPRGVRTTLYEKRWSRIIVTTAQVSKPEVCDVIEMKHLFSRAEVWKAQKQNFSCILQNHEKMLEKARFQQAATDQL